MCTYLHYGGLPMQFCHQTWPYPDAQTHPFLIKTIFPRLFEETTPYNPPIPPKNRKCHSQSSSPTKKTTTTTSTKMRSQPHCISPPRNNAYPNRTRTRRILSSSTTRPRRNRVQPPLPPSSPRPLSPLQTPIS